MAAPRILVVAADDRSICQALKGAMGHTSASVHTASSASAAFSLLARQPVDILFLDLGSSTIGGIDGIELTRLMCQRRPDVDVIAVTETPSAAMTMDMLRAGAADCLDSAVLAEEIGGLVDNIMERRHYRHERVRWPDGELDNFAIIGSDPKFIAVYKRAARLARSRDPILIVGERGTGKTAVAREIHRVSRAGEPFVVLLSTTIAQGIAESELFGHVGGAFTDAKTRHEGYFERAGRGTLVIDEVADLSPSDQGKLLRVLQERKLIPVGGTSTIEVHARIIAITNRPLEYEVGAGRFRPDLYDRLVVGWIHVPPLRKRRGEIPLLAHHFAANFAKELALPAPPFIVPPAIDALVEYDWPGNVRELENTIKSAVLNVLPYAARVILVRDLELDHGPRQVSTREGWPRNAGTTGDDAVGGIPKEVTRSDPTEARRIDRASLLGAPVPRGLAKRQYRRLLAEEAIAAEGGIHVRGSISRAAVRLGVKRTTLWRWRTDAD